MGELKEKPAAGATATGFVNSPEYWSDQGRAKFSAAWRTAQRIPMPCPTPEQLRNFRNPIHQCRVALYRAIRHGDTRLAATICRLIAIHCDGGASQDDASKAIRDAITAGAWPGESRMWARLARYEIKRIRGEA